MKIFVFGAGASQAVQDQDMFQAGHDKKAPLVNELFNDQYSYGNLPGLSLNIDECR